MLAIATVQLLVTTLFPGRFNPVPILLLILAALVAHIINICTPDGTTCPQPAHHENVVMGRATALLPLQDSSFGKVPAAQGIVVFNLGVQFNHPRGKLCPHGLELARRFAALNADLMTRRDELGLLDFSQWEAPAASPGEGNSRKRVPAGRPREEHGAGPPRGAAASGAETLLMKYYFRSVRQLHHFAHEEMHEETWRWFHALGARHIGIFHETYEVPSCSYENIYVHCRPVLLGGASVKCNDEKWYSTLVDADCDKLKGQFQRMNRNADGTPKQEVS